MADETSETGLIGGLERRELKIVDYGANWPYKFERRAKLIAGAVGGTALRIEHIGSTSVSQAAGDVYQ